MILVSRNGADTLPMALEALAACEMPPGGREVLLVDNGSSDETPALMRAFAQDHAARVLAEVIERDNRDMNRADAPLKPAPDALMIDTSDLSIDQAVAAAIAAVRAALP